MRASSTTAPAKFWFNVIGDKVELFLHENIVEVTKEEETHYESDMYFGVADNNRDAIIAGFVRLKYSIDKEFALLNKGIANPTNVDYISYRDYVQEVKNFIDTQAE